MVGIGFTKLNHPSISLTKIVNGWPFLFALLKFVCFKCFSFEFLRVCSTQGFFPFFFRPLICCFKKLNSNTVDLFARWGFAWRSLVNCLHLFGGFLIENYWKDP